MQGTGRWGDLVDQRVVVRHRLPQGGATDVLGVLLDVAGGRLRVRADRDGIIVEIPLDDVLAGKPIPPRPARPGPPHRALSVADLEAVTALHWQAIERARLGGWLLRASGGFTGRGNSALPLGDPGMPVPEAFASIRAWYDARRLPPVVSLAEAPVNGSLRSALIADGWRIREGAGALVLTARTAALARYVPPGAVALAAEPDDAWLQRYRYRGQPLPPHARALLMSATDQVFASVRDGERAVAVARGSLSPGWAGVTAVDVAPDHRRRGLASLLLAALARWAAEHAATATFVQVGDGNGAALALYERAGFSAHHRYDYWESSRR